MARRQAIMWAMVSHACVLAAFVLAWPDGLLLAERSQFYDQVRLLQLAVLAIGLPWAAARCMATERGDQLVLLCASLSLPPSSVVMARTLAVSVALVLVSLAGLPITLVAGQMSGVSASRVVGDLAALVGLAHLTAAITLAWMLITSRRLLAWQRATASIVLVVIALRIVAPDQLRFGAATALAGIVASWWLVQWSTHALRYISERRA
jgi:hypothetical protein